MKDNKLYTLAPNNSPLHNLLLQLHNIEDLIAFSNVKSAFKTTIQFIRSEPALGKDSDFLILSLMYSEKYYRYTTRHYQGVISDEVFEIYENQCTRNLLELIQSVKEVLEETYASV